jgi:hypothetical protein
LECNLKRRRTNQSKFLFTKQLKITCLDWYWRLFKLFYNIYYSRALLKTFGFIVFTNQIITILLVIKDNHYRLLTLTEKKTLGGSVFFIFILHFSKSIFGFSFLDIFYVHFYKSRKDFGKMFDMRPWLKISVWWFSHFFYFCYDKKKYLKTGCKIRSKNFGHFYGHF